MSRTLSAAGNPEWLPLVDRAGLMLDEPTIFQQQTDDPGYTGWTPGGDEGGGDLASAVGQTLYNADYSKAGRLIKGGPGKFYLTTGSGTSQRFSPFRGGTYLVDAGGGDFFQLMLNPQGGVEKSGTGSFPTGTSYAPQAYGSTQAGQTQSEQAALERQAAGDLAAAERLEAQLQAQEDEAIASRDFARAERIAGELAAATAAKIAAQNQLKLARLGEAGALARTFEDIKSRARDVIAGMMGENPFRGAVRARGGVPRGVDPYEAFEAELGGVANMPTPQFSSESNLGQLESAIAAMQKTQMPTAQWPMGAGGTVRPGEVVKVGDLGEPEYVYNRGDGVVEVIPGPRGAKIAGRAAYGGAYSFDKSSIEQVLSPMYSYLGFDKAPQFRGGRHTQPEKYRLSGEDVGRLGISPRLVRDPASNAVFWVDPEGYRRWIPNERIFEESGFDWGDVVDMPGADIREMTLGRQPGLREAPPLIEPYEGSYPQQAVPLGLPGELGGYALPDPRTIANLFRTFDPANREILLDALGLSEMGREQASSLLRAFTPAGTGGGRVGYG